MLFKYSGEFVVPPGANGAESIDVMARFAAMVSADPDFELGPVTLDRVGFRAAPFGLGTSALDRFNDDLLERVNASGELDLEGETTGRHRTLFVTSDTMGACPGGAERAWEVITDEFRGLLVDSSEHRLRWEFGA